jgi:hypothetical protein
MAFLVRTLTDFWIAASYRRVNGAGEYCPAKTIDSEGGRPNDRSAICPTTLPLQPKIVVWHYYFLALAGLRLVREIKEYWERKLRSGGLFL